MDITCAKCGEPWDAYGLRHDMSSTECVPHSEPTRRNAEGTYLHTRDERVCFDNVNAWFGAQNELIEAADNGEVPPEVAADIQAGNPKPGWLNFVALGKGCPHCYGKPELQTRTEPLSFTELDDIDAATEGRLL